jgi:hypothetical protein
MGFNFRKSIKIAPGIKLNISKNGISSISAGTKGARVSVGKKGTRTTVGAPGTGLSYTHYKSHKKTGSSDQYDDANLLGLFKFFFWVVVIFLVLVYVIFF